MGQITLDTNNRFMDIHLSMNDIQLEELPKRYTEGYIDRPYYPQTFVPCKITLLVDNNTITVQPVDCS